MAYSLDGEDILINGFEKGISESPYAGINDIRGMNIVSIPGEASVAFSPTNNAPTTFTCSVLSADSGTEIITFDPNTSTGAPANYQAIIFTGGALPGGIVAGTVYWVLFQGVSDQFKIYSDCYLTNIVNITSTGTGTAATVDMKAIRYFERTYGYAIDEWGRVWSPTSAASWTFMGNTLSSYTSAPAEASGNGIVAYKGSGSTVYLFVFKNGRIDYTSIGTSNIVSYSTIPSWQTGWNPATGSAGYGSDTLQTSNGVNNPHEALVGQDNVIYYVDASFVGSLRERSGSTFDPTTPATYVFNGTALAIPKIDIAQCLEELGVNLLVGGVYNFIYPWDRISSSFKYPIFLSEKGVVRLLTVNTNTYIFAGTRGRILITNGTQADLYIKMPDHLLGIDPIYQWYGVGYNKNQIYFGIRAKNNAGTIQTTYAGLWAVDITTKALRVPTFASTSTATVTAMWAPPQNHLYFTSAGFGLQVAWKTVNGSDTTQTAGIDASTSSPYTSYVNYIDTDMIPVGLYLTKKTLRNIEYKLSSPMVSGESLKILYRTTLSDTYTQIGETVYSATEPTNLSDVYTPNFQNVQWIQLRIQTKSTSSSPSYVRLREIRIR